MVFIVMFYDFWNLALCAVFCLIILLKINLIWLSAFFLRAQEPIIVVHVDMESHISSEIPLQKHSSPTQCRRVSSHVVKCWNLCPNRNQIQFHGVHLYESIWNMLKLVHSVTSRVGCVGKVLRPHTKKGFSRSIHFRIQMYTNVSKTSSRVSSTSDFDVSPASVTFFQLSLAVNLQRHKKRNFHLTNLSCSAASPLRMRTLIASETSRNDR